MLGPACHGLGACFALRGLKPLPNMTEAAERDAPAVSKQRELPVRGRKICQGLMSKRGDRLHLHLGKASTLPREHTGPGSAATS
jgi:hypothetical protein